MQPVKKERRTRCSVGAWPRQEIHRSIQETTFIAMGAPAAMVAPT